MTAKAFGFEGEVMEKKQGFLISVIMPVYNTENYVRNSIDCLISQTLGFEKNIQLILINDGSTDGSDSICREYKEKYPDNIVYLTQEHKGVSAARNLALGEINAKYVNFLDSDDLWTETSLKKLYDFFEKNYDKTDVVVGRKKLFDGASGYHILDYRFEKTGIFDLDQRSDMIHMDVASSLIKTEAIGGLQFCEKLLYGEDTRFINTILLEKCTVGIVREAEYCYRKRADGSSSTQQQNLSDSYYFDTPEYMHKFLFDLSRKKYGSVKKFIQYSVMYDITWRVKKPVYKLLPKDKAEEYKKLLSGIMQDIDDGIIYHQRSIYMNMKMYCLSLKYGHDVRKDLKYDAGRIKYKDYTAIDLASAKTLLIWDYFELHGNILRLEGKDNCWMRGNDYNYYAKVNGEIYYPSYVDCPKFDLITMEGRVNKGRAVVYEIHLNPEKETRITFFFRKGDDTRDIFTSLGRFSHLPKVDGGYYSNNKLIVRPDEKGLHICPYTEQLHNELEENFCKLLHENGQDEAVQWRRRFFEETKKKKRDLWMISDRTYVAGDNGEHFFRYLNKWQHKKKFDTCFNIDADSPDNERLSRIGKVINYGTDEYKMCFLLSDMIISSSASDYLFNPFGEMMKYLVDLVHYDFVFLQHGITKDDLSAWLNRYNKNISMMVTSAVPEYLSIVNGDYCMTKDIPVITGLPRFDSLYRLSRARKPKKKILFMPTWRQGIKGSYNSKENKSIYSDKFCESHFFSFYNSLINDRRLLDAMRDRGYKGLFCMHPMQSQQWRDFDGNDVITVNEGFPDYQNEFVSSSLMITDYSSVAFDFSYLKKPVIYAQFDKEEFYRKHTYDEGYFDYERDGFGEVCYDLDSTVDAIIRLIENDCRNDEKYLKRVEKFYPYSDSHCCRRVYEHIKDLKYKYGVF